MSERYTDAVRRVRRVMDSVEEWLTSLPDGSAVTAIRIQQEIRSLHMSYDQAALALNALAELGVLDIQNGWILNRLRLLETATFRAGVRIGLDHALAQMHTSKLRFLAALPAGLPLVIQQALQREADDLRATLVGLLAQAEEHLLLASPFWDDTTITDLGDILERRLKGGIRVDLLGRSATLQMGSEHGFALIIQRLQGYTGCRAFTWNEMLPEDRFGTQTFHFKCIIADYGKQAYLGTANLTSASLRSRMELGVLLTGEDARTLSRIVTQVLSVAHPWRGEEE